MIRAQLLRALIVVMLFPASGAWAADVYLIQGLAYGPFINGCDVYEWLGDAVFHNSTVLPQTITLVDINNRLPLSGTDTRLTIQPGRTTSINVSRAWTPSPSTSPWVVHLDVPNGIQVESRFEIGFRSCLPAVPRPRYGKLSIPFYTALQPAGVARIHVGTDLAALDARNNIAIFNASNVAATAHVEIHQGCDDSLLRSADFVVPPNTTQQFSMGSVQTACPTPPVHETTNAWITYLSVTVDQPSLSWVSTIANTVDLTVPYAVSSSQ